MPGTRAILDVRDPTVADSPRVMPGDAVNRAIRVNVIASSAGGGVVQQGARDATVQPWYVRIAIDEVPTLVDPRARTWTITETVPVSIAATVAVDVTDEPTRDLGRVRIWDGTDTALVTAGGLLQVDASGVTVPISAASLPLPTGAATEATLAARLADATFTGRINTQGQKAMAASTPVVIASDQSAVPVSGTVSVTEPVTVDGTVTANPAVGQGKTLLFAAIAQGGAGTTALVGADVSNKIKLVSYVFVMSLLGTAKFTDGTVDLTGAMDIAANGGVSAIGQPSAHLMETAAINRPLNVVTTLGAARGHISYFKEP